MDHFTQNLVIKNWGISNRRRHIFTKWTRIISY